jgi:hypothetical protein
MSYDVKLLHIMQAFPLQNLMSSTNKNNKDGHIGTELLRQILVTLDEE